MAPQLARMAQGSIRIPFISVLMYIDGEILLIVEIMTLFMSNHRTVAIGEKQVVERVMDYKIG